MILQVPGGNVGVNAQAAADAAEAPQPANAGPDGQAPANPHEAGNHGDEAGNHGDEAELEDDDDEWEEDEDEDEEGREDDAAEANNGGQGQCKHKDQRSGMHFRSSGNAATEAYLLSTL